jgi:ketosteroid isomerase-like protein
MKMSDASNTNCERACESLCVGFAIAVDQRDYAACIDLFAEDAVFEHVTGPLKGRAEILAMLEARPLNAVTRHMCTNIVVEALGSTEARGRSYVTLFRGTAAPGSDGPLPSEMPLVAEYQDRYVFVNGAWKIQHRKTSLIFV